MATPTTMQFTTPTFLWRNGTHGRLRSCLMLKHIFMWNRYWVFLNQQEQSMYRRQQRNCAFDFCWYTMLFGVRLNRKYPHEETGDVISSHAVAQKGQRGSKLFDSQHREECASWVLVLRTSSLRGWYQTLTTGKIADSLCCIRSWERFSFSSYTWEWNKFIIIFTTVMH